MTNPSARAGEYSIQTADHNRLIDPIAPIIGQEWLETILADPRKPDLIFESLKAQNPNWRREVQLSAISYLDVLRPGLDQLCLSHKIDTTGPWTLIDKYKASIPLEILLPLHQSYADKLSYYSALEDQELETRLRQIAEDFSRARQNCVALDNVRHITQRLSKVCRRLDIVGAGHRCQKYLALNEEVVSAEASFPRTNFSINGFTAYVYKRLMQMPMSDLLYALQQLYKAEHFWIEQNNEDKDIPEFSEIMITRLKSVGISPETTLLLLAYSTRNMSSLDVQYGLDPEKALLLEVYFWKFNQLREPLLEQFFTSLFFNTKFEKNFGIYHYYTAALHSCMVRKIGFGSTIAGLQGLLQKIAYKAHKFMADFDIEQWNEMGFTYLRSVMKDQGTATGMQAGLRGGQFGSAVCAEDNGVQQQ